MSPTHPVPIPLPVFSNVGSLPEPIRQFERTYDRPTGGWLDPRSGNPEYGSVELEVGRLWYALTMLLAPVRVLETGTYFGYSTCNVAAALKQLGGERSIITIDPEAKPHLWDGTELEKLVRWMPMTSQDAAPKLAGSSFDMLVLDSDHHYNTVMFELMAFEPMLRVGGAILLHDSLYFDGVGAAVRQLEKNPRFECLTLDSPRNHGIQNCRCPGITLVRKRTNDGPALVFDAAFDGAFVGDNLGVPLLRTGR